MKKISILIPCFNEEMGIGKVIDRIPNDLLRTRNYEFEVIVIDNNSQDNTAAIALAHGARVVFEEKKGKGNAIRKAFSMIDQKTHYVVMLDGDHTYDLQEILRLIEPLDSGFCDVIIGSRLSGKSYRDAFKFQNRVLNWGFAFLVRRFYRANITDALSGYYAWRREVIEDLRLHLQSGGFSIEMEMITKMVKLGYSIYSVPISFMKREGEKKIRITDAFYIIHTFLTNMFWTPKKRSDKDAKAMIDDLTIIESHYEKS